MSKIDWAANALENYPFVRKTWIPTHEHEVYLPSGDTFWQRFRYSLTWFTPSGLRIHKMVGGGVPFFWRFGQMWFDIWHMRRDKPDEVLRNSSIITVWGEDADYITLVQPKVGDVIAEFLRAEPDHPYAKKISETMWEVTHESL